MQPDIFISYKREDLPMVKTIEKRLTAEGWLVWWDHDIPAGRDYDTVIQEAITAARCVIVLWTDLSINSRNVKDEANVGLERNVLIPVVMGGVKPPIGFRMIQAVVCQSETEISDGEVNDIVGQVKGMFGETTDEHLDSHELNKKGASSWWNVPTNSGAHGNRKAVITPKKILVAALLIAGAAVFSYGIIGGHFFNTPEAAQKPTDTTHTTTGITKQEKAVTTSSPSDTLPPATEQPAAKPAPKKQTTVPEKTKPPERMPAPGYTPPEILDISGKWRTDEGKIWTISQMGTELTIRFEGEAASVKSNLSGHTIEFHELRKGQDKKGSFTVSADGKSMFGKVNGLMGTWNSLTITKVE